MVAAGIRVIAVVSYEIDDKICRLIGYGIDLWMKGQGDAIEEIL